MDEKESVDDADDQRRKLLALPRGEPAAPKALHDQRAPAHDRAAEIFGVTLGLVQRERVDLEEEVHVRRVRWIGGPTPEAEECALERRFAEHGDESALDTAKRERQRRGDQFVARAEVVNEQPRLRPDGGGER